MRIAWFRPARLDPGHPFDDTAALVESLRARHAVETFDRRAAHDFVWKHFRQPFDACVYELDDTPVHQYLWPYLLRHPGITLLRCLSVRHSRAAALEREERREDYARELAFSGWPMLRAPLLASRLVVVAHAARADALRDEYPDARIRHAAVRVSSVGATPPRSGVRTQFGFIDRGDARQLAVLQRALQRAREAGASLDLIVDRDPRQVLAHADVLFAVHWPTGGQPLVDAVAAMAAARVPIVFDTLEAADWPSLDPQTWQSRGYAPVGAPICVSVDVRDEEHSLMLAMRRLSADGALRTRIAEAAHAWWRTHATVDHAVAAFEPLLLEARSMPPPPRPADWPPHLTADGTERAREILREFGVTVDFLEDVR